MCILLLSSFEILLQCANGSGGFDFILLSDSVLNLDQVSSEILVFRACVSEDIFELIGFLDLVFEVDVDSIQLLVEDDNFVLILGNFSVHIVQNRESSLEFVILTGNTLNGLFILRDSVFGIDLVLLD